MLLPGTVFEVDPKLPSDETRCTVCHHDRHGDGACLKPYCLCEGDAP